MSISCFGVWVDGIPAPQGSKVVGLTKGGKPFVRESSKRLARWRQDVEVAVKAKMLSIAPWPSWQWDGAIRANFEFYFPITGDHKDGDLKISAPDLSKLQRAVEDSITDAGLWTDDARLVQAKACKYYGQKTGAQINIWKI